jgi:natural resistance-associated macrophage protein 2
MSGNLGDPGTLVDDDDDPVDTADDDNELATTGLVLESSGSHWKNFWHFVGPGWFVSIAYMDPGNYQADNQAEATTRYSLQFALWWT